MDYVYTNILGFYLKKWCNFHQEQREGESEKFLDEVSFQADIPHLLLQTMYKLKLI